MAMPRESSSRDSSGAAPQRRVIRKAAPPDLDVIDRVERAAFDGDRFARRNLRRMLTSPTTVFLIAEESGGPAGYVALLFRRGARAARLYSIAVDPAMRGRGVGESLLAAAAEAARARGADRLRLEVRPSNNAAMRLYDRAGFTFLERKPRYYRDGEDAVRLELQISRDVQRATGTPNPE